MKQIFTYFFLCIFRNIYAQEYRTDTIILNRIRSEQADTNIELQF
jgi:hypothetical protein